MISSDSSQFVSFPEISSTPDLTPMLDVIFMLLVFFMLTANRDEHVLAIELPEKGSKQATLLEQQETITLTLYPESERWGINDRILYDWNAVEKLITDTHEQQPDVHFLIIGDRHVNIEQLLQVFSFFKSQGISVADILMQPHTNLNK